MKQAKAKRMMNGGMVRGRPGIDNNLVALSRGEAVLPRDTTQAVGPENIRALIAATHTPTNAPLVRAAANGMVPAYESGTEFFNPDRDAAGFPIKPNSKAMPRPPSLANWSNDLPAPQTPQVVGAKTQYGAAMQPATSALAARTTQFGGNGEPIAFYVAPKQDRRMNWSNDMPAPPRSNVPMRDVEDRSAGAVASTDASPVVAQVSGGGRSLALTADQMEKEYGGFKGNPAAADKMKAEYAAMKAQEAQDAQSAYNDRTRAMMDNMNWAEAWTNKRDAQLGYYGHSGTANSLAAQAAREKGLLADSAMRASETKPEMRDYLGEQERQQANIDKSLLTAEGLRQSAAMGPLAQRGAVLKNTLAQAGVDLATMKQSLMSRASDPKAKQEDRDQAMDMYQSLFGQLPRGAQYSMHVVGAGADELGRPLPQRLMQQNNRTGEMMDVTPGQGQGKPSQDQAMKEAKDAIARGAPKDAVNARLKSWGYPQV